MQKNQRYNISEDTWKQVLAFSRCVHENLKGYDPEGNNIQIFVIMWKVNERRHKKYDFAFRMCRFHLLLDSSN